MDSIPTIAVAPFIILLLCIALCPLFVPQWWHHHYKKLALSFAMAMAIYNLKVAPDRFHHTVVEYVSFMALMAALFVVSGGIVIQSRLEGKPIENTALLLAGSLLASVIGTTGASMVLIRPLIRANSHRTKKTHTFIFFIFMVSNIGGILTALGDPPLFLGFLQGVPFGWTSHLIPEWATCIGILSVIHFAIDLRAYKSEKFTKKPHIHESVKILGAGNFGALGGIILTILLYPHVQRALPHVPFAGDSFQIICMTLIALASYRIGDPNHRKENGFEWTPVKEVAILFAGIFSCMVPALLILEARGSELGVKTAGEFFWASGTLSSFLDNAPTYLTFLSLGKTLPAGDHYLTLFDGSTVPEYVLTAISLGSVFMGANTYIGNGPNFMVKSIVDSSGTKMPSFFGYMLWSVGILIPLFLLIHFFYLNP